MYFKKLGFSGFSQPVQLESRIFFALKQIPHIGGHFKTLTFKIGGLEAEIFTRNHKSIPIYNYTGWHLDLRSPGGVVKIVTRALKIGVSAGVRALEYYFFSVKVT